MEMEMEMKMKMKMKAEMEIKREIGQKRTQTAQRRKRNPSMAALS
jgi:hypothetical protein